MNFVILYFSGTGNTQLIGEEIQRRLEEKQHQVECISVEALDAIETLNLEGKILGCGFPVYKFTYPGIFEKLFPILRKLQRDAAKTLPYFVYCTYTRFSADSLHDFAQKLDAQTFSLIAQAGFKCPSNGIASLQAADSYAYQSVMFFEDDIVAKLDAFVSELLDNVEIYQQRGVTLSHHGHWLNALTKKVVEDIERVRYPQLRIAPEECIGCGICAKHCPEHNLIQDNRHIEVVDALDCLHCLRCMHHCPKHAISFGELVQGPQRYTLKIRDALFERAKTGEQTAYWQDFDKIRSRWRREVLRYWLTHRLRYRKSA
ncbi:MAG: EFR1 family ferrodoxin [Anaerolineae bacterium]|nr:EFR1 family ferrodoxin [Anaerolineae bacterium]